MEKILNDFSVRSCTFWLPVYVYIISSLIQQLLRRTNMKRISNNLVKSELEELRGRKVVPRQILPNPSVKYYDVAKLYRHRFYQILLSSTTMSQSCTGTDFTKSFCQILRCRKIVPTQILPNPPVKYYDVAKLYRHRFY